MSRYRTITQALIDNVRAVVPEYNADLPFICAEDGTGGVQSPTDWITNPQRRTREFDTRSIGFTRPGPGCNVLSGCAIRIVYELTADLGLLDQIINSDIRAIINGVMFNTTYWGAAANSVYMEEGVDPTFEIVTDGNDNPATVVVSIPIMLDYRRSA